MKNFRMLFLMLAFLGAANMQYGNARAMEIRQEEQNILTANNPLPHTTKHHSRNQVIQSRAAFSPARAVPVMDNTFRIFLPAVSRYLPVFYVSPAGNDTNPGTLAKPWRTIQKAANTLVAGQTVKILPGTYNAKFAPLNSGKPGAVITYTADPGTVILDGTNLPMSTYARGDGLVQIQGKRYIVIQNLQLRNSQANCVNISEDSAGTRPGNIEITGLGIQNCLKVGIRARFTDNVLIKDNVIEHITYSSGIGVWWAINAVVDGNTINNAHYYHECQGAYDEALTIAYTNHFEVRNNTLDNIEPPPAGFCSGSEKLGISIKESSQNGLVYRNTVRHMNAGAIYFDGWHAGANNTPSLNHVDVFQNFVHNSAGIVVGCEQSDGVVEYINIYNNILINPSFAGIQVRKAHGDGLRKNIKILNNTIYGAFREGGNGGAGIYITTANLGSNNADAPVIIRNNISMFYFLPDGSGTVGQIVAANDVVASKIAADHNLVNCPLGCKSLNAPFIEVGSRITAKADDVFRSPAAFDLHLNSGSPAIDAGIAASPVTHDYDGIPRPQPAGGNFDIGAYEYR